MIIYQSIAYISTIGMFNPEEPDSCEGWQKFPNKEDTSKRYECSVVRVVSDRSMFANFALDVHKISCWTFFASQLFSYGNFGKFGTECPENDEAPAEGFASTL